MGLVYQGWAVDPGPWPLRDAPTLTIMHGSGWDFTGVAGEKPAVRTTSTWRHWAALCSLVGERLPENRAGIEDGEAERLKGCARLTADRELNQ